MASDVGQPGAARYELGVDIGGTFTDLVLRDTATGDVRLGKTLTTPRDPARGALDGIGALLAASGIDPAGVGRVVHGTTLVTNLLIERKGARTAYVTTRGFAGVFETGRQKRYDMYDLAIRFPEPLVPPERRFELGERVDARGCVRLALEPAEVRALAPRLLDARVEAVAVCFLHSHRAPQHERLVAQVLGEAAPGLVVCLSCEVAPEIREYPRACTTVANAYVIPATRDYLRRLQDGLRELGCAAALHVMLSHGGLATAATVARFPIRLLESGPAGGAVGAGIHATRRGSGAALAFDMGGTTAKVCLLERGAPRITSQFEVARVHRLKRGSGLPVRVRSVDLIEIGAGGGSVARVDGLGLLQVGPDSAGADPGPACYGRGGALPTVTDADLLLGYLNPASFLGGALPLDPGLAQTALTRAVAAPLGSGPLEAAWAIHTLVNAHMAGAVRVHAAERGVDVRAVDLIAYGGAGPVHADRLARTLGLRRVVVPPGAGVASALGFLAAPLSFDFASSGVALLDDLHPDAVAARYAEMRVAAQALLDEAGVPAGSRRFESRCDMRYAGQGYEIDVPLGTDAPWRLSPADLRARFVAEYRRLYGRDHPDAPVEAVTWRLVASAPPSCPAPPGYHPGAPGIEDQGSRRASTPGPHRGGGASGTGTRLAYAPELGGMAPFGVYHRARLRPGDAFAGPAIVEEGEATTVVGPGASAMVDEWLNLVITLPRDEGRR